jgi:hypothetical protein
MLQYNHLAVKFSRVVVRAFIAVEILVTVRDWRSFAREWSYEKGRNPGRLRRSQGG